MLKHFITCCGNEYKDASLFLNNIIPYIKNKILSDLNMDLVNKDNLIELVKINFQILDKYDLIYNLIPKIMIFILKAQNKENASLGLENEKLRLENEKLVSDKNISQDMGKKKVNISMNNNNSIKKNSLCEPQINPYQHNKK